LRNVGFSVAQPVAHESDKTAVSGAAEPVPFDAELARIVAAWPTLDDPIRRAMLALIG
jgi:hypothetical protein